jgi:CheY-like chemotaxis protein
MVSASSSSRGGHISVYSESGIGTTFRLFLPRMTEEVTTVEESSAVPLVHGRGETVLVVEDNAALRRVVMRQLGELGYRVLDAENAAEGLQVMEKESIDLLLTDVVMPGGTDGRELARRARQRWPSLKVVFTSGFSAARLNGNASPPLSCTPLLNKPSQGRAGERGSQALDRLAELVLSHSSVPAQMIFGRTKACMAV